MDFEGADYAARSASTNASAALRVAARSVPAAKGLADGIGALDKKPRTMPGL
jgi:hypothetical protein